MEQDEDFLDEIIAERTKRNPDFPRLVAEEMQRRKAMRARGEDPNDDTGIEAEDETSIPAPETAVAPE